MIKPNKNWVLNDRDPLLRKKCATVVLPLNKKQSEAIDHMVTYIDACYENKDEEYHIRSGIGLAGPQVGLKYRVIYIHGSFNDVEHRYLLANPKIVSESKLNCFLQTGEGCLSVEKEVNGIVKRKNKITVVGYDLLENKERKIIAEGPLSICLQHEIDHLDGILYYDRINKFDPFYKEKDWIQY